MTTIAVPYHLDESLERFAPGVAADETITATLPAGAGPGERMGVLYERVADAVARSADPPIVASSDCTTSLGVLAGLQRAGAEPGIVWFDGHADFHTAQSTTSGYLGGLALAQATGVGEPLLPGDLGLRPVPPERVVLLDARDTDPPEHGLLAEAGIARTPVAALTEAELPAGPIYLHLDLDVLDPGDLPGLLYPARSGPRLEDVLAAVRLVMGTGRVVAVGLAATWDADAPGQDEREAIAEQFLAAISG